MIIQANNSISKYTSSQILDLMSPPSPDSNRQLYNDYHNFIGAVDAIYGTQDSRGTIPVFRTKQNLLSDDLSPDPDSTLKYLIPNQSYLFVVNSDAHLPLKIPNPIGFADFATKLITSQDTISRCCPLIDVQSSVHLDAVSGNTHVIRADISDMVSNEKYYFEISPVFSNWPAQLSGASGELVIPDYPNSEGKVNGYIESVFTYYKYLTDDLEKSIPFTVNKSTTNESHNKNIFTILKLKIFNNRCAIYDKNIIIKCDSCVAENICPDIQILSQGSGTTRYITTHLSGLQHNTQYRYEFNTDSSNLEANISSISGIVSKGINQDSTTLYNVFRYCDGSDIDCNLGATTSYYDPSISAHIYTNLIFNLYPVSNQYCDTISANTLIECDRCFDTNNFKTSVIFSPPVYSFSTFGVAKYPVLGDGMLGGPAQRPSLEYNLYSSGTSITTCCDKPAVIELGVKNAIAGDRYTYEFTSYPQITIIPNTGIISFGNTSGVISVLGYIEGQKSSSIHVVLTHEKSNQKASDSTIIRCPEGWV